MRLANQSTASRQSAVVLDGLRNTTQRTRIHASTLSIKQPSVRTGVPKNPSLNRYTCQHLCLSATHVGVFATPSLPRPRHGSPSHSSKRETSPSLCAAADPQRARRQKRNSRRAPHGARAPTDSGRLGRPYATDTPLHPGCLPLDVLAHPSLEAAWNLEKRINTVPATLNDKHVFGTPAFAVAVSISPHVALLFTAVRSTATSTFLTEVVDARISNRELATTKKCRSHTRCTRMKVRRAPHHNDA